LRLSNQVELFCGVGPSGGGGNDNGHCHQFSGSGVYTPCFKGDRSSIRGRDRRHPSGRADRAIRRGAGRELQARGERSFPSPPPSPCQPLM